MHCAVHSAKPRPTAGRSCAPGQAAACAQDAHCSNSLSPTAAPFAPEKPTAGRRFAPGRAAQAAGSAPHGDGTRNGGGAVMRRRGKSGEAASTGHAARLSSSPTRPPATEMSPSRCARRCAPLRNRARHLHGTVAATGAVYMVRQLTTPRRAQSSGPTRRRGRRRTLAAPAISALRRCRRRPKRAPAKKALAPAKKALAPGKKAPAARRVSCQRRPKMASPARTSQPRMTAL